MVVLGLAGVPAGAQTGGATGVSCIGQQLCIGVSAEGKAWLATGREPLAIAVMREGAFETSYFALSTDKGRLFASRLDPGNAIGSDRRELSAVQEGYIGNIAEKPGPAARWFDATDLLRSVPPARHRTPVSSDWRTPALQQSGDRSVMVPVNFDGAADAEPVFITVLPADPMRAHPFDPRFGYFKTAMLSTTYDFPDAGPVTIWNVDRGGQSGAMPAPKPIKLYLDPAIPAAFKAAVREGTLAWNGPLKAAGAGSPIEVSDPPVGVDWLVFSQTHSSIQWWPRAAGNVRQMVVDPRSGEIVRAAVVIGPNGAQWYDYFLYTAANDTRALTVAGRREIEKDLFRVLASHEMGHLLGLRDGNYGKIDYPFARMRSKLWLDRFGFSPSIMNYNRANYIAQPRDRVQAVQLLPAIGPSDYFQIRWAYGRGMDDADIARALKTSPWLRYSPAVLSPVMPQAQWENIGTDDPVSASLLGLKNLQRAVELAENLTVELSGEERKALRAAAIRHWGDLLRHPIAVIGGFRAYYGADGPLVTFPLPSALQRRALAFAKFHLAAPPSWLIASADFEQSEALKQMLDAERKELFQFFAHADRAKRIAEGKSGASACAYKATVDELSAKNVAGE
ncbi:zinc-dependent metalloprotease [Sphingopyxis sp. R3-92]|uniref:zinc-dependent metalloprotease n=1 Tax=Sphingopyxis sp. R3-92 TaxID=3158553 RepID=UPI003EE53222